MPPPSRGLTRGAIHRVAQRRPHTFRRQLREARGRHRLALDARHDIPIAARSRPARRAGESRPFVDRTRSAQAGQSRIGGSEQTDYRLPELLGGIGRSELPAPVPYPVACSPQAWSAAAPLLLLRAVLGLEPDVPAGVVRLSPTLPEGATLRIERLRLGAHELDIDVGPAGVEVHGAEAAGLRVVSD
jgi:hypothetical protein